MKANSLNAELTIYLSLCVHVLAQQIKTANLINVIGTNKSSQVKVIFAPILEAMVFLG